MHRIAIRGVAATIAAVSPAALTLAGVLAPSAGSAAAATGVSEPGQAPAATLTGSWSADPRPAARGTGGTVLAQADLAASERLPLGAAPPAGQDAAGEVAPPAPSPPADPPPKDIARAMLDGRGWGGQFSCLDSLWTKESRWNVQASNAGSGAYGIPQALPGSKMSSVGADWRTNPATQIQWGLDYIAGSYGSPCGAWQHSQSYNWY